MRRIGDVSGAVSGSQKIRSGLINGPGTGSRVLAASVVLPKVKSGARKMGKLREPDRLSTVPMTQRNFGEQWLNGGRKTRKGFGL